VRGANNRHALHGRAFDFVIHVIIHVNNPILNEYGFQALVSLLPHLHITPFGPSSKVNSPPAGSVLIDRLTIAAFVGRTTAVKPSYLQEMNLNSESVGTCNEFLL
jgi:hypothetical protein